MKTLLIWLLALMSLATVEEVATSPTTFAVCKTVDIATTAYLIENGLGVEANPVVASILGNGYIPLIALSVGLWYLIKQYNNPYATAGANVMTCGIAIHNLLLIP